MERYRRAGILMITFSLLITSIISCERDNPAADKDGTMAGTEVSEWIYDWMNMIYLWEDKIPGDLNPLNEQDPLRLFESLLYREEDKWSFITDDFNELFSELIGTPTSMGYSPSFGKFQSGDQVFIVVEYVIPGTPAARAGLKRGDIILSIDGKELDINNYFSLFSLKSYTAGLGYYNGSTITPNGESLNLEAEMIRSQPVIHSEVIDYQNKKIGYLVYVDFMSGINNVFVNDLDTALATFADEEIEELIVDLRYNPGGEIFMASYLASAIAPSAEATPSNVLVSYVYNDYITEMFTREGGENSTDLNLFFSNTGINLNMDRVYFLTGSGTASASELVITGLDPYMEVIIVGDTTVGKYTGAWVFPDTEDPPRHNYAMVPIVLKYANSEGLTEFKEGLFPDYPLNDWFIGTGNFGSYDDPIFAKTLEVITGVHPLSGKKKSFREHEYSIIPNYELIQRRNINLLKPEVDYNP